MLRIPGLFTLSTLAYLFYSGCCENNERFLYLFLYLQVKVLRSVEHHEYFLSVPKSHLQSASLYHHTRGA